MIKIKFIDQTGYSFGTSGNTKGVHAPNRLSRLRIIIPYYFNGDGPGMRKKDKFPLVPKNIKNYTIPISHIRMMSANKFGAIRKISFNVDN